MGKEPNAYCFLYSFEVNIDSAGGGGGGGGGGGMAVTTFGGSDSFLFYKLIRNHAFLSGKLKTV